VAGVVLGLGDEVTLCAGHRSAKRCTEDVRLVSTDADGGRVLAAVDGLGGRGAALASVAAPAATFEGRIGLNVSMTGRKQTEERRRQRRRSTTAPSVCSALFHHRLHCPLRVYVT
jgi:hypothetical protein